MRWYCWRGWLVLVGGGMGSVSDAVFVLFFVVVSN